MDVRWVAYAASGLFAAISLAPVGMFRGAGDQPRAGGSLAQPAGSPPAGVNWLEVAPDTARLRPQPPAAEPADAPRHRNPFRFSEPRAAAFPPPATAPEPAIDASAPPPERGPGLTLIGMVERQQNEALVRTAVVAGPGDVHLVSLGERVEGRFVVQTIGPDGVELRDEQSGGVWHLRLEPGR